jgi:hypothetical protein
VGQTALRSHGTLIRRADGGVLPLELVDEVLDVTPAPLQRTVIDGTSQSDEDDYKILGMRHRGDAGFGLNYSPGLDSHQGIIDSWANDQIDLWEIEYSNGAKEQFSGGVVNFEKNSPLDDKVTASVTIAVFGAIEYIDPP